MHIVLYPKLQPVLFQIGNISIRLYGLILAFAIALGVCVTYFILKDKYSKDCANYFIDFIPPVVVFSILGARFFYVLGNIDYYLKYPQEIIMLNHGGISIWGAIIFGIAGIFLFLNKKIIKPLQLLDAIAPAFSLSQAIGRWGNFFNQEAFGYPTNFFIKLYVDPEYRPPEFKEVDFFHPAFLYESIFDLIIFAILLFLYLKVKNLKTGTVFLIYIILYSIVRIFVESIRIDSVSFVFGLPVASVISIFALILSLIFLYIRTFFVK